LDCAVFIKPNIFNYHDSALIAEIFG